MYKNIVRKIFRIFLFFTVLSSIIIQIIIFRTPENCTVREWIIILRQIVFAILGVILIGTTVSLPIIKLRKIKSTISLIVFTIIMWGLSLMLSYMFFLRFVFGMPTYIEKEYFDDKIIVFHEVWLDKGENLLCQKQGMFYMKFIDNLDKEKIENNFTDKNKEDKSISEYESSNNDKKSEEEKIIYGGAKSVYEFIKNEFTNNENTINYPKEDYDAKGNIKFVVYEDDKNVVYIKFDRFSKNDKCTLYVLYCDEMKDDNYETKILNMYAYDIKSGEVFSSGKTSWEDIGSTEYQLVTGE